MDILLLVGGLYFLFRGLKAYNGHDDPSWRTYRGDYAIQDGCTGCLWWVIAVPLILVAVA